jgi:hypothetical protein
VYLQCLIDREMWSNMVVWKCDRTYNIQIKIMSRLIRRWKSTTGIQGIAMVSVGSGPFTYYEILRYPPAPGKMGHIAICDGEGGTVEAKGHAYGVVADTVHGRLLGYGNIDSRCVLR